MKTLFLIDANSLIHRAYHALPKTMNAPSGAPTNAIYGLARIMLKLIREEEPDYIAACFDRPEPTFRKKEYKEYKAHRPPTPDDLISQIIEAHKLFESIGIKTFEKAGFEADDIIATLANNPEYGTELKIVIITGDLDTLQLVRGEDITVRAPKKGISEMKIYNEEAVNERYGLSPGELLDYKALVGDPSDNIKGVPGVGPKTATTLIKKYGDLEHIIDAKKKDPSIFRGSEASDADEIMLSKKLVTLRSDVPIEDIGLDSLRLRFQKEEAVKYFGKMGFNTLLRESTSGGRNSSRRNQEKDISTSRQSKMF